MGLLCRNSWFYCLFGTVLSLKSSKSKLELRSLAVSYVLLSWTVVRILSTQPTLATGLWGSGVMQSATELHKRDVETEQFLARESQEKQIRQKQEKKEEFRI